MRLQRQNEEGIEEVMALERKRAMARMALGGEGMQRSGDDACRETEGVLGAGGGMAELKRTVLCETVPWLGAIKPKGAFETDLCFAGRTRVRERSRY